MTAKKRAPKVKAATPEAPASKFTVGGSVLDTLGRHGVVVRILAPVAGGPECLEVDITAFENQAPTRVCLQSQEFRPVGGVSENQ